MVVLTFVKDTFSSQTLFILLIFIFGNYRGASKCEEVWFITGGIFVFQRCQSAESWAYAS